MRQIKLCQRKKSLMYNILGFNLADLHVLNMIQQRNLIFHYVLLTLLIYVTE